MVNGGTKRLPDVGGKNTITKLAGRQAVRDGAHNSAAAINRPLPIDDLPLPTVGNNAFNN